MNKQDVDSVIPIGSKSAKCHADDKRRRPFNALRPVATNSLLKVPISQTQQIGQNGAICAIR